MGKHRDRVCGADVHKDLIVATITGRDETQISASFGTSPPELERFKEWLIANNCEQVAYRKKEGMDYRLHTLRKAGTSRHTLAPWPW